MAVGIVEPKPLQIWVFRPVTAITGISLSFLLYISPVFKNPSYYAATVYFFHQIPNFSEIPRLTVLKMMSLANPSSGKFSYFQVKSSIRISHMSPSVLSVSNHTKRKFPRIKSASMALTSSPVKYSPSNIENFSVDKKPVEARIDDWMEGSVTDIVQNLKQAPLLVHVYPPEVDRTGNPKLEFKIEKAIRKNWPIVKSMWRSSEIRSPDGLIFVEELVDDENSSIINEGQSLEDDELDAVDGVTRAWGILVQGRGVKCGPACYLLKTTRVDAGCGLGLFCTHFCLTKVTDYQETAFRQLQDFWLLP